MWTDEDKAQAWEEGWTFDWYWTQTEPLNFNLASLVWVDPAKSGKTWDDDVVKFVAEQAAKGDPLYEKAWLFYVTLEMQNRIIPLVKGEAIP